VILVLDFKMNKLKIEIQVVMIGEITKISEPVF